MRMQCTNRDHLAVMALSECQEDMAATWPLLISQIVDLIPLIEYFLYPIGDNIYTPMGSNVLCFCFHFVQTFPHFPVRFLADRMNIVDLVAIVPFYIATLLSGASISWPSIVLMNIKSLGWMFCILTKTENTFFPQQLPRDIFGRQQLCIF